VAIVHGALKEDICEIFELGNISLNNQIHGFTNYHGNHILTFVCHLVQS
jgi:hypothetical protein